MSSRTLTLVALLIAACAISHATEGEVVSIQGDTLNILVRSGPAPAVGDTVSVMNRPDENGNATPVGQWRVTEVRGNEVKAVLDRSYGVEPVEGMAAFFTSSRGPAFREGPDVVVPGSASSGVPGTVTEVRGEDVTIRLEREAAPVVGDRVELSFSYGEDTVSVGTWRVTGVRGDGRVDAEPVAAEAPPTPRMEALVFATGAGTTPPASDTPARMTPAEELFAEAMSIRPKDGARAVTLFVQAAELGNTAAAEQAGLAYANGLGVARDDARAAGFLRRAAEAGRPEAQNFYGAFLATGRGGLARDDAQALIWYRKAAAQGESWAQANLCARYEQGDGVQQDLAEALRLCRLSEAQNNPAALNQLGWMYQRGSGVEKDLAQAFQYYRRAAELGHANGQNNLAYCYEHGWGVTRDYGKALDWYNRAAAQGFSWAEWNLGRLYDEGIGVTRDQAKAVEHWQRAARSGHAASQEKLQALGYSW